MPHFVCEACQVRQEVGRELFQNQNDGALLMLERMRKIYYIHIPTHQTVLDLVSRLLLDKKTKHVSS